MRKHVERLPHVVDFTLSNGSTTRWRYGKAAEPRREGNRLIFTAPEGHSTWQDLALWRLERLKREMPDCGVITVQSPGGRGLCGIVRPEHIVTED